MNKMIESVKNNRPLKNTARPSRGDLNISDFSSFDSFSIASLNNKEMNVQLSQSTNEITCEIGSGKADLTYPALNVEPAKKQSLTDQFVSSTKEKLQEINTLFEEKQIQLDEIEICKLNKKIQESISQLHVFSLKKFNRFPVSYPIYSSIFSPGIVCQSNARITFVNSLQALYYIDNASNQNSEIIFSTNQEFMTCISPINHCKNPTYMTAGTLDGEIYLFDYAAARGNILQAYHTNNGSVTAIASHENMISASSENGEVSIYDIRCLSPVTTLKCNEKNVNTSLSMNSSSILTSAGGYTYLWELKTQKYMSYQIGNKNDITKSFITKNGCIGICNLGSQKIDFWDGNGGTTITPLFSDMKIRNIIYCHNLDEIIMESEGGSIECAFEENNNKNSVLTIAGKDLNTLYKKKDTISFDFQLRDISISQSGKLLSGIIKDSNEIIQWHYFKKSLNEKIQKKLSQLILLGI